jgi:deoxyribose-phosphate aldolase
MEMDRTEGDWKALISEIKEQIKTQADELIPSNSAPLSIAPYIDHTVLTLDATSDRIDQLCEEAKKCSFAVRVL